MLKRVMFTVVALLMVFSVAYAAGSGKSVIKGSKVKMDYTLTVEGQVVDTSKGKVPLNAEIGKGMLIKGFESSVIGMKAGQTKKFTVKPEDGYGVHDPKGLMDYPRDKFAGIKDLKKGLIVAGVRDDGTRASAAIVKFDDKTVTLDFNHPLAGKTLQFEVTMLEVN